MISSIQAEYTHQKMGENYYGIAGYYTPQKEARLEYDGRSVLYVVGRAVLESSCCGEGEWNYVLVPGYIVSWHSRVNDAGLAVSKIEPILDGAARSSISQMIQDKEGIDWVSFWS